MPKHKHGEETNVEQEEENSAGEYDEDEFECVVCGADAYDGEGWIFPTEDTEVTEITPSGLERDLVDNPRAICSISCKNTFSENDEYESGSANTQE